MHSKDADEAKMRLALQLAQEAANAGEVPVGAVVFRWGALVATGRNAPVAQHDPTAHAEIVALRAAAKVLGNYRLDECEVFVTLEPCAMCSGALLQARVQRVVFGAFEPKTGAGGSVLNLFEHQALNHQTELKGGVLAAECGMSLQDFFRARRSTQAAERKSLHPLRDDALRTPDGCFEPLADYPWPPRYLSDLPALEGLRLHYLDLGPVEASVTYLCLHGRDTWSYFFRTMIPILVESGARLVAPDLIGFGKSDKPKRERAHNLAWHHQVLLEWVERLQLKSVVLVLPVDACALGLHLLIDAPHRYCGLLLLDSLFGEVDAAGYRAPFPDNGHRAALGAFKPMGPHAWAGQGTERASRIEGFLRNEWQGQTLLAMGKPSTDVGDLTRQQLRAMIRGCPPPMDLDDAEPHPPHEAAARAAVTLFGTGATPL